ncbi:hypothetical protein [Nitratireductor sp. XY-223]|uniref:hypothetical protein n=1 Tax=Nitratireductor sp. XY-223 TaxID=2561926 RepID=UPI0010AA6961|nr:hypothetical protein [Nitratireductor sp. XY-223]
MPAGTQSLSYHHVAPLPIPQLRAVLSGVNFADCAGRNVPARFPPVAGRFLDEAFVQENRMRRTIGGGDDNRAHDGNGDPCDFGAATKSSKPLAGRSRTALRAMIVAGGLAAGAAHGEETIHADFDLATINENTPIVLIVKDRVTDGCWLTAPAAETKIKRELIEAGFDEIDSSYEMHEFDEARMILSDGIYIYADVFGHAITTYGCAVVTAIDVSKHTFSKRHYAGKYWSVYEVKELHGNAILLTGEKSDMSSRINSSLESAIDAFIVAIHEAKRQLTEEVSEADVKDEYKVELLNAARPLK